jgi:S1-C subfamily serine protease
MTNEMQEHSPTGQLPPPPDEPSGARYGHWSPDPRWGPPSWPPAATFSEPRSSGMRRLLLAGFAIVCVGAGGGTAWALTEASITHPATASLGTGSTGEAPNSTGDNPGGGSTSSNGGSVSSATIAKIEQSVVDINAETASKDGEVAGTGMIITSNGLVLTNNHVIDDTINITAQIDGTGPVYKATVIGYDASDDVGLIQLQGVSNLPTVPIGDSSKVAVGDAITVLGNALGKGGTPAQVTGTVTQLDQQVTASDESGDNETLTGMIQVAAAIEPGDSGGPELNSAGQVIGMTTAGSQSGNPGQETGATTGFAIPINKAMSIISLIRAGSGPNIHIGNAALLGVEVSQNKPQSCATSIASTGAWVNSVVSGSPAGDSGIQACSRITEIGGHSVGTSGDLHTAMESFQNNQSVTFDWMDPSGASHSATITLGEASFPD